MRYVEKARSLRPLIEKAVQSLDDEDAMDAVNLHPPWEEGITCEAGSRVQHKDILYTVLTTHVSQADWTPDAAPSLFAKVLIPDKIVITAWEQPDSTNPYMAGNQVTHNGKIWISDVDNNVWEPGAYGWTEVN